jgi:quercetin dioxygenase-like cupin family protein
VRFIRKEEVQTRFGDDRGFTGTVCLDRMLESSEPGGLRMLRVYFEPGGRTRWHTHSGEQILNIVAGRGLVQSWGEQRIDVSAGDIVHFAPGEKHWHGARSDSFMVHIAVATGAETDWMEEVSEAEYLGEPD